MVALYLVKIRTIQKNIIPSDYHGLYNFIWTTSGRRYAIFLTTTPLELASSLQEQTGFKPVIERAPRNIHEFFELLKTFIELDYRITENGIEIATPSPGKLIGTKGRNIIAIKRHISINNIKVVECWTLYYDTSGRGNHRVYIGDSVIHIQPEELAKIKPFYNDSRKAYLSPWSHRWLLDRIRIERKRTIRYKCGHIETEAQEVEVSRFVQLKHETIDYDGYCYKCYLGMLREAKEDFEKAIEKYGYELGEALAEFIRRNREIGEKLYLVSSTGIVTYINPKKDREKFIDILNKLPL